MCPAMRSVIASAAPLYGACVRLAPVCALSISAVRWACVPCPGDPKTIPPARDFASSTNDLRSCASRPGYTTSTVGGPPKSAMCVKLRSGSNGTGDIAGAITCDAMPETTSV